MSMYKQTITLADGQTGQMTNISAPCSRHSIQVDGPGTATIRVSINKESGLHAFDELTSTLVTTSFPGVEVWEITASGGEVTVTICGD